MRCLNCQAIHSDAEIEMEDGCCPSCGSTMFDVGIEQENEYDDEGLFDDDFSDTDEDDLDDFDFSDIDYDDIDFDEEDLDFDEEEDY